MTDTAIEWTDKTWNPVTGCSKVSPGCAHCYAEGVAERFWATQCSPVVGDDGRLRPRRFTDVQCHEHRLDQPLHWWKPSRIFVNSMSDLFHEDVPDQFLHDVYHVMEQAHWHTFQILTKRAARMHQYLSWRYGPREDGPGSRIPSRHIWHGVSVENQHWADNRIPFLCGAPSAVRFISAEPLLGPIDLSSPVLQADCDSSLDWVIIGGESGSDARVFNVAWARSLIEQCRAAGVAVFMKQLGRDPVDELGSMTAPVPPQRPILNRKGGDPSEWPEDLRVREFPDR